MFQEKGQIVLEKSLCSLGEDDVMLLVVDAGAEDFNGDEESYEVLTAPEDFAKVKEALDQAGIEQAFAEVAMLPLNTVKLVGDEAEQMVKLMDALDDHDDVQNVYSNFED
jgi:transcriptional/translational regulatory protein YebC/TACO1